MNDIQIRLIRREDFKQLFDVIERNRERLLRFFPKTSQTIIDLDSAKAFTEQKLRQANKKEQFYYVVQVVSTSEIIGGVMLKNIDWSIPKAEFAYFIDGKFEGKGITTYAVKWLTQHAFTEMEMQKLYIKIDPNNWRSKKVAMNNGFELEGLLRSEFRTGKGELTDVERYGLLKVDHNAERDYLE